MDIERKINEILLSNCSIEFEDVKDNIKKYLIDIEVYLAEIQNRILDVNNECTELKLNKTKIVKQINIARQTYYNNKPLLEKYMDIRIDEINKMNILNKLEAMKSNIAELNYKLYKSSIRDIEEQILLDKIEAKDNIISELINKNKSLEEKVIRLLNDVDKNKVKNKNNISNFKRE